MKAYLGDGVYVEVENGMLKLTTEVGLPEATNTIFLEPEVFANLQRYYEVATAAILTAPTAEPPQMTPDEIREHLRTCTGCAEAPTPTVSEGTPRERHKFVGHLLGPCSFRRFTGRDWECSKPASDPVHDVYALPGEPPCECGREMWHAGECSPPAPEVPKG